MLNCVYTLLPSARLWFEENQLLGPGLLRMEGWPVKITSIKSGIFVPLTVTVLSAVSAHLISQANGMRPLPRP